MIIYIRYTAQLRRRTGLASEELTVAGPLPLQDAVKLLEQRRGPLLDSGALVFVNDEQVRELSQVHLVDGDVVTFLAPIAGG